MLDKIYNENNELVSVDSYLNAEEKARCAAFESVMAQEMPKLKLQNALIGEGFEIPITTLTAILKTVTRQKFYTVPFADYVPVRVGEEGMAWRTNIVAFRSFVTGGAFESGYIDTTPNTRLATTDVTLDAMNFKVYTWAKEVFWSIPELQTALVAADWEIVSAKERSRKANWDLGLQQIVFMGNGSGMTGLINQDEVNIDTTLITTPISEMSDVQLNAFARQVISVYRQNTNYTAYPNRFYVPESDYNGLASYANPEFMLRDRFDVLENVFKKITRNPDFKILPLVYLDGEQNGLGHNRYILMNYDEETIRFDIPVPYTSTLANTFDGFYWRNVAYGQHSDLIVLRPREILYLDETPAST